MGASDDNKVDVEWNIMFNDGVVATIYNWKNDLAVWEQMVLMRLITKYGTLVEKPLVQFMILKKFFKNNA